MHMEIPRSSAHQLVIAYELSRRDRMAISPRKTHLHQTTHGK